MSHEKVNLTDKLSQFYDHGSPKIVTDDNSNDIMVVTFQGGLPFHDHPDTVAPKPHL